MSHGNSETSPVSFNGMNAFDAGMQYAERLAAETQSAADATANSIANSIAKPVELDTRIELASYSFGQKDFDRTHEHAQLVLEQVPGDPRALALIAACQIVLGNVDDGFTRLNRAIHSTAIPRYEEAAEETYEHLRFADDHTVEISWQGFNDCVQFLSQPEFVSQDDVSAWKLALERARACVSLDRDDIEQGINDLRAHLRLHPNDVEARFELGRAYFNQEKPVVAAELFRQVLDEKPGHASALSLLGRVLALEGDYVAAIPYAKEALAQDQQNCRVRMDVVDYLFSNQQYRDALNVLDGAPKCTCGWFRSLHARMECYRELGDFDTMVMVCEQLLDLTPDEVTSEIDLPLGQRVAMANMVLAIAKIDGRDKAFMLLEQEADLLVSDKQLALDMASLYRAFDELEMARRLTECLSYQCPLDEDVLLTLSIAEGEAGNAAEEMRLLKDLVYCVGEAISIPHLRLSLAYERQSRFAEALYWASQGRQIDDLDGQLSFQLARVYARLNAAVASRRHLDAAIAANTSCRGRAAADVAFATVLGQ